MFVTFEGVEGSGKTTQMAKTRRYFEDRGFSCVTTREPGDTDIGKKIRKILLDPENRDLVPHAELFLYAADRVQHIQQRILPALENGSVVICDRFADATTVYQGYARGIDLRLISDIHRIVLDDLKPDITFLFDIDPAAGLERAMKALESGGRSADESRFEQEHLAFHEKVRSGYLALAEKEPERIVIIDASPGPDEVFKQIKNCLDSRFLSDDSNKVLS